MQQEDLKVLCSQDVENILPLEITRNSPNPGTHDRIAFWSTYNQAAWHFAREEYKAKHAQHGTPKGKVAGPIPKVKGAISESGKIWLYWHHDLVESKLTIQRLVIVDKDELERNSKDLEVLLSEALREAFDWDIRKVIVWSPCKEVVEAVKNLEHESEGLRITFEKREKSSVPSLRVHGGKYDVTWVANEYFAWC